MTKEEVMTQLEKLGSENIRKIFKKHGAPPENLYGVKVADLKTIVKKVKKDHALSLDLYGTGNGDAMYLAGLIADEKKITKAQLRKWANQAKWSMISEYTVAWVAAESPHGMELAREWIESDKEHVAAAGWSTFSSIASITPDQDIDLKYYSGLLDRVVAEIHSAPNRVRYTMNGFVIAVGSYLPKLTGKAKAAAKKIGKVSVDMHGTACKVPGAQDYIAKVEKAGRVGRKRKMARC